MKLRVKICGMKHNSEEVATLFPDYLGFIFYEKSPRNFTEVIPKFSNTIQKVGVFVNEDPNSIVANINKHDLQVIQLHGEESRDYLRELKRMIEIQVPFPVEFWKVFSIDDSFAFSSILAYEPYADKYLFDTKGDYYGGHGIPFDWNLMKLYPSKKPFILSGGIGPDSIPAIRQLENWDLPLYAVDLNSRFETEPGRKNVNELKTFINEL